MTQAELLPFDGVPPERLQRSLGLIKPDDRRVARRALLVMAIGWVPLAWAKFGKTKESLSAATK